MMSDPERRRVISTTPATVEERRRAQADLARDASQRRFWILLVVALVLGAGGAILAVLWLDRDDDAVPAPTSVAVASTSIGPPPDATGFAATVSSDAAQTIAAATSGTLTSAVATGEPVVRGDVVAEIDGRPVVAMYGEEPFTRPLVAGDIGPDVAQLEANLVLLGFDPDQRITVDDRFTAATADAVAAWEQTLGIPRSGTVPLGRAVAIAGPMTAGEIAEVGSVVADGTPIVSGPLRRMVGDLVLSWSGTVTDLLEAGTPIATGDVVALVDDVPVLAVAGPRDLLSPVIDALAVGDVQALESALVFFGQDPDGQITVDDVGDLATLAALGRWQVSAGLRESIEPGSVHLLRVPEDHVVDVVHLEPGGTVEGGALLYTVGSSTAIVEAAVPVDQAGAYAVGDRVEVALADGRVVGAAVTVVAEPQAEASPTGSEPEGDRTVAVTVRLDDVGDAASSGGVTLLRPP